MTGTVTQEFHRSINALCTVVYIDHGIRGVAAKDGMSVVFENKRGTRRVTLSWNAADSVESISWHIERTHDGTPTDSREGVFPAKDPGARAAALISELAPTPPTRTVDAKGKLAVLVFGWTMLLGALALLKLLAVSTPEGAWAEDDFPLTPLLANAQQISNALTLGDLPLVVVGSFLNSPFPGLVFLFGIGMLFILYALPRMSLAEDNMSWRAAAIYVFTVLSGFGVITFAPSPWNIVTWVVLIYLGYAVFTNYSVASQLQRWARFARRVLVSPVAEVPSTLAEHFGDRVFTLGEIAEELEKESLNLRRRIWRKRDKALESGSWNDAYFTARMTKLGLAAEVRAAKRSRPANRRALVWRHTADARFFRAQQWSLFRGIPLLTVIALGMVVLSPTPWIAPVCASSAGDARTVYVLPGGNPTYFDETTREVTVLTSWDGYTLAPGPC